MSNGAGDRGDSTVCEAAPQINGFAWTILPVWAGSVNIPTLRYAPCETFQGF
jgi:hypothetical protein